MRRGQGRGGGGGGGGGTGDGEVVVVCWWRWLMFRDGNVMCSFVLLCRKLSDNFSSSSVYL